MSFIKQLRANSVSYANYAASTGTFNSATGTPVVQAGTCFVPNLHSVRVRWVVPMQHAMRTGWSTVMDLQTGAGVPPAPSADHRAEISIPVTVADTEARYALTGHGQAYKDGFDPLIHDILTAPEFVAGQVPLVEMTSTDVREWTDRHGVIHTLHVPLFSIEGWIGGAA